MTDNLKSNSTHKWDKETIKQYGNDRCSGCGMKYTYYLDGIETLKTWTIDDIETDKENFGNQVKRFKVCEPR